MGISVIIEMDSNSKLGPEYISHDPHQQSLNGKLLAGILERHGLVVANGLMEKCVGSITRRRKTVNSTEESIIDHILPSSDLVEDLESVLVDEEGNHALTKIIKTKNGITSKQSDHNTLVSKFKFSWNKKVHNDRMEMFNLKNRENQIKFKEITSNNDNLSVIFDNEDDLNVATNAFIMKLNKCITTCFKKIRVREKPNKEVEELFQKRKELRSKDDEASKTKLNDVESKLADLCAESNYNKIREEISDIKCEEGGINSGKLWKLKKKLSPDVEIHQLPC